MKRIIATSEEQFFSKISNKTIKSSPKKCYISIIEPNHKGTKQYNESLPNYIRLEMEDIIEDSGNHKVVDDNTINRLINFIEKNKNAESFIVHCHAGISRSGAIVTYLKERFEGYVDLEFFNKANKFIFPNQYILTKLRQHKF